MTLYKYYLYFHSTLHLFCLYLASTLASTCHLPYLNSNRIVRNKLPNSIATAGFWDVGSLMCAKFSREFIGFLTVKSREGATFVVNSLENFKERWLLG